MKQYELLSNPDRFVWDFWYWYDVESRLFHVYYLNADPSLVPDEKYHFSARVGYGITTDFRSMDWIDNDCFCSRPEGWDNSSIWTGDVIQKDGEFLMYYTSRNAAEDDSMTQHIGIARSPDLRHWERNELPISSANSKWYETRTVEADTTIHAWRDPFLFRNSQGVLSMLLCSNSRSQNPGRKGSIALLENPSDDALHWESQPPVFDSGYYTQCEVPQTFLNKNQEIVYAFSSWASNDHSQQTKGQGGLIAVYPERKQSEVLYPEKSGLYACKIIPELGGDIVGFDIAQGGLRRIGLQTGFQHR